MINELRKSGKLTEAYDLAKSLWTQNPGDVWAGRAYGWVLYSLLRENEKVECADSYLSFLSELCGLWLEDEMMLWNSVAWSLSGMMRKFPAMEEGSFAFLDGVLALFPSLPFPEMEDSYSALLSAALKVDKRWSGLPHFLQEWGWENLRDKDYEPVHLPDGKNMMSVAERAILVYAKWLLSTGTEMEMEAFLPFLSDVVAARQELLYPTYYLAKLYIRMERKKDATLLLMSVLRKKYGEFWVWQLLSETMEGVEEKCSFLCKALSCGGKEEMLVGLREQAALLFAGMGHFPQAKWELDRVLSVRCRNHWRVPPQLMDLTREDWYASTSVSSTNRDFYKAHLALAEEMFNAQLPLFRVLISNVNAEKRIVTFLTEKKECGFFRLPSSQKEIPLLNSVWDIRTETLLEGEPTHVCSMVPSGTEGDAFFRTFSGELRIAPKGFSFVDDIYIPKEMLVGFRSHERVKGRAVLNYSHRKNLWGWKVLELSRV